MIEVDAALLVVWAAHLLVLLMQPKKLALSILRDKSRGRASRDRAATILVLWGVYF
jgi:hypothetical protein